MPIGLLDEADRHQHTRRFARQRAKTLVVGPQRDVGHEVLQQVAGQRKLGKDDELGAFGDRGPQAIGHQLAIGVEVAQSRGDLCEGDPVLHAAQGAWPGPPRSVTSPRGS